MTAPHTEFLRCACSRPVMRRAVRYAIVVGALLITINHGDALVRADVSPGRLVQMLLTALVPYLVSTLSSVEAMRARQTPAPQAPGSLPGPAPGPEERPLGRTSQW